ncbi:hypothetical protein [Methylibium sp.]|uniref:hypothetical protein n=1 Tax=Methylibium sp. TaxID=2067992 RepID=UPI0025D76BED|nr:hypothetical protein [Methylibium sp.]
MTESQRAMIAAELAGLRHGTNQHAKEDAQICASSPVTQTAAADMLSVSRRSVQAARVRSGSMRYRCPRSRLHGPPQASDGAIAASLTLVVSHDRRPEVLAEGSRTIVGLRACRPGPAGAA